MLSSYLETNIIKLKMGVGGNVERSSILYIPKLFGWQIIFSSKELAKWDVGGGGGDANVITC